MHPNFHQISYALIGVMLAGCVPKHLPTNEEPPAYASREGRNDARLGMAATLIDHGKTAEAHYVLSEALKEKADLAEVNFLKARILLVEGLPDEAEELLRTVIKKRPRDVRAHRMLGIILSDRLDIDMAIDSFETALRFDKTHAPTFNNVGFLYYTKQEYPKAKDYLLEAVKLDGSSRRYKMNYAFALAALGKDKEALRTFKTVGSPSISHTNLAVALEQQGDTAQAIHHHQQAVSLDPRNETSVTALQRLDPKGEDQ